MTVPRPEYPRPQMERAAWLNLNGPWQFAFDPDNTGMTKKWFEAHDFDRTIIVPFCVESPLSGIGDTGYHDVVWYQRTFTIPPEWSGQDVHLHIGACDFETHLYLNSQLAGHHRGGYTPISVDVTPYLRPEGGENTITIRAYDKGDDKNQPRGKQDWEPTSHAIFYTRTTGIWQTVWLEPFPANYLRRFDLLPEFDAKMLIVRAETAQSVPGAILTVIVHDNAETHGGHAQIARETVALSGNRATIALPVPHADPWSPETPSLYPVTLLLESGTTTDTVKSYFGMRKVEARDGKVCLNGQPYFLKLVLDQGFWPDGLYTAPTDDALKYDVEAAKAMGYNGARKHQKVEDPRWLYWADTLGFVTWGETGNSFGFTEMGCANFRTEWPQVVARDLNHPCVIAWVPFNESWGIEGVRDDVVIQEYVRDIVAWTKQMDPTRLVVANDGWEQINETDLMTLHDYDQNAQAFHNRWARAGTPGYVPSDYGIIPLARRQRYNGQPVVISEFGGIALKVDAGKNEKDWGYGEAAADQQQFLERFAALNRALLSIPGLAGCCYTQLTDVEQEINGLLSYDRRPKAPLDSIREANSLE